MKVVLCLALLAPGLLAAAQLPFGRLERASLFGAEYVRLEDWARSHDFQTRWIVPRKELKLASPGATMLVEADSRKMTLNGINVWLSVPVAVQHNTAYMAPLDLASAVHPVLYPPRNPAGRAIRTIVIDPGHGGKDPGNREGWQQEKKLTLLLAKELGGLLTKAGFNVELTRTRDSFVELPERAEIARRRKADLFLSLHFNAADGPGGSGVKGAEVYCMTPARASSTNARGEGANTGAFPGNRADVKNMLLAYQVQKALVKNLALEDRGVRRARFAVLRAAEMPAVLIEAGFMTNPAEARKIYDSAYRRRVAQAIVEGVLAYKKTVEK